MALPLAGAALLLALLVAQLPLAALARQSVTTGWILLGLGSMPD